MSSVPYEIIAASKPFRFLVGPDKKEFTMHAELVARMSKPLWTLVNGKWKDSKEGLAEWPEIDEATFIRFCEFAYTGDYKAAEPFTEMPPTPSKLENERTALEKYAPEPKPAPAPDPWDDWGAGVVPKKKSKKTNSASIWSEAVPEMPLSPTAKRDAMWRTFQEEIDEKPVKRQEEEPNTNPSANYSEVLLSHARLYAFADYNGIEALMGLCIRKLHRMLTVFNLHGGARATDVAQLIDYSFKHTRSGEHKQDKLRCLVATYTACHIEDLWPNLYFQDVLESSDVSKSIIGQLLRRVS
ncbi:hypothetical protein F5Y06DRAFT_214664 [Hypoxylon sp. FL0890]|nr:hypothetical protein F5Y06DRAFT_214664 [Hypoxylon sp. FL0890]